MRGQTMSMFENSVDQLLDWLKPCMVTPIREQCGNNIVIRKFENSTSFLLEKNGHQCIFTRN